MAEPRGGSRGGTAAALVRLARPRDWLKNAFVLMPAPFALATGAELEAGSYLSGLAAACLASSAVHAFNDARDAALDRLHASKRRRPVAAGELSRGAACAASAVLAVAALLAAVAASRPWAVPWLVAYVVTGAAYSLGVRHVPLADVFVLAAGFVLRVVYGCALLAVAPSAWLLLCSSALALFLALAKRRGDLIEGTGADHRPSLAGYDRGFLDHAMTISAATCLVSYALYCMGSQALTPGRELASLPFVVFGVLEYLRLAHVRGEGASPADVLLRSPALVLSGLGWLAAVWFSLAR